MADFYRDENDRLIEENSTLRDKLCQCNEELKSSMRENNELKNNIILLNRKLQRSVFDAQSTQIQQLQCQMEQIQ